MNEFATAMPEDFDARPSKEQVSSEAYAMSAPACIWHMLGLVGSFAGVVTLAVLFGVLGFLCAIFIPVIALAGLGVILDIPSHFFIFTSHDAAFLPFIVSVLIALSVLRGCLRYLEQLCNHYIAFKLLAVLRDKVFGDANACSREIKQLTSRKFNFAYHVGHRIAGSVLRAHYLAGAYCQHNKHHYGYLCRHYSSVVRSCCAGVLRDCGSYCSSVDLHIHGQRWSARARKSGRSDELRA